MQQNVPVPVDGSTGTAAGSTAKLIYVLYLVGVVVGITAVIGVVMAYVNRNDAPDWVRSHYTFQIRTFWISLLGSVIGAVLSVVGIGLLVLAAVVVWWIVRCIKGMKVLDKGEPHPNPTGWGF